MDFSITAKELSFSYKNNEVIKNADFFIPQGTFAAVIGDNGEGKSTLLAILANIIRPKGELVTVGKTAYLPQDNALVEELTFEDNLKYFASLAGVKVPSVLPFEADKLRKITVKKMSGGMKKLCSIICTMLSDADIYILDEPCAALDKEHREMLYSFLCELKAKGKTIVYAAHNEEEYSGIADLLLHIENGRVDVK